MPAPFAPLQVFIERVSPYNPLVIRKLMMVQKVIGIGIQVADGDGFLYFDPVYGVEVGPSVFHQGAYTHRLDPVELTRIQQHFEIGEFAPNGQGLALVDPDACPPTQ
jgi:hypothetical protein